MFKNSTRVWHQKKEQYGTEQARQIKGRVDILLGLFLALALSTLGGWVNWQWLAVNQVTYGWDRMDHLITSLVYNNMLLSANVGTLFEAISYSNYYPPLFHYSVLPFYRAFGISEDIAPLVNVVYLFVLLYSIWSITRRLSGRSVSTLAVTLAILTPMFWAMSRYLYLDFALTALIAAAMSRLLASERFTHRANSLLFGLVLGLAFWIKWTTAAFLIGPLLFLVVRSGILSELWHAPARLLPNGRRALICLIIATAFNLTWLLPSHVFVHETPLGWWLILPFSLLLAAVFYALFAIERAQKATRLQNALGAAAIGGWIISLWYLTNIEFFSSFMRTAYGEEGNRYLAYEKYLREVVLQQLGPFFSLLILLVFLVWLFQRIRERVSVHFSSPAELVEADDSLRQAQDAERLRERGLIIGDTGWVLLLWVIVPYVIFSTGVSLAHARFIMPILPPFSIWLAVGISQWHPGWLRGAMIGLALLIGSAQYVLISTDGFEDVRSQLALELGGQQVNALAHGFFIQYPADGVNDLDFAIGSDVLNIIETDRLQRGAEMLNLGILMNSYQLHEKHFLYQIYIRYPQIRLRELARNWSDQPTYNQIFEMDYLLVSDTHTYRTDEESQAIAMRLLTQPEDLFNFAFEEAASWTFPTGERATLFKRRFPPTEPGNQASDYHDLFSQLAGIIGPEDAILLTAPDQAYLVGLFLPADHGLMIVPLGVEQEAPHAIEERLWELSNRFTRLFYVRHNVEMADPSGAIERWLQANLIAGPDFWAASLLATPFVSASEQETTLLLDDARWSYGPALLETRYRQAGNVALVVDLLWAADNVGTLKASLQLIAPNGALVAQSDQPVRLGEQRALLLLPNELAAGDYSLMVNLYEPATGERWPLDSGGDTFELHRIILHDKM